MTGTETEIRWKLLYTGGKKAHAFYGPSARTSLCGKANTLSRGPWVFAMKETFRCEECLALVKKHEHDEK